MIVYIYQVHSLLDKMRSANRNKWNVIGLIREVEVWWRIQHKQEASLLNCFHVDDRNNNNTMAVFCGQRANGHVALWIPCRKATSILWLKVIVHPWSWLISLSYEISMKLLHWKYLFVKAGLAHHNFRCNIESQ